MSYRGGLAYRAELRKPHNYQCCEGCRNCFPKETFFGSEVEYLLQEEKTWNIAMTGRFQR